MTIVDINLPDINLVHARPIPKIKRGGNSLKLKCAKANINDENTIPITRPKSLDNMGSNTPLKIISSKSGARIVVVINNIKKAK